MKKILSLTIVSLACAQVLMAQDTYTNDLMTNASDIHGTARYIGMGGAVGALGGEISGISNNPAGIGGFNRSWASTVTAVLATASTRLASWWYCPRAMRTVLTSP